MTVSPAPTPLNGTSHNNQSLFSDHYLKDILRRTAEWQAAMAPAGEFLTWLRQLYAQEKAQLPHYKESQLEDNWFKPIFNRLGHTWEGQAAVPGLSRRTKKPDFVFFPDEAARKTAVSLQNSSDYARAALAVGEVKQWEVNLSKKTGTEPIFADQNPMYQIDTYLTLTGLEWGLLSNGRFWRLLHKNSSRTLETYFEIDLLAALEQPDETKATAVAAYFWLFFNQAAFRPDKHGRIFLNDALEQSRAYALALEADLRDNAYRSLEQLILGFFAANPGLDADDENDRARVYRNSLYLLYRLLFLFYGESRALLPMHNPTYKEDYSLQRLAQTIDSNRSNLGSLPATGHRYWNRLSELFRLISGGDARFNADLGVPRYNGGLFDPQQHPFLENRNIGDRYLAQAIDYLAYRRVRQDGRFQGYQAVDYRTLDVRQLGSIYEGLLEYKVTVAAEEMVTVRKKGVEVWLPARSRGKSKPLARRPAGELYLATDKGERKATGSYYTPDYIVEYIVENTLRPLVAAARQRVKEQVRRAKLGKKEERQQLSAKLFIDEILALNILDPAMGSGHFLVESTNYLARALATDEYTQVTGPPVTGASKAPVASEDDLLYWKRRVVEACIYGVDKNPMAVELAKLSLWLKTAAADKPLSFLDHHLQCGDSLIGAWLDDLSKHPISSKKSDVSADQQPLFDDSAFTRDAGLAVGGVMAIERATTNTIEDIHLKEQLWRDLQQTHIGRWRRLADVWVSAYFGNEMVSEEYRALADQLQGRPSLLTDAQAETFLAHPAVTDNDYFHWELAFPEVFFDEYGRSLGDAAGFDAVIGNPPYGDLLTEEAKNFTSQTSDMRTGGRAEIYATFLAVSFEVLKKRTSLGFIIPNTLIDGAQFSTLREYLSSEAKIDFVRDYRNRLVFADANVLTMLIFLKNEQEKASYLAPYEFWDDEKNGLVEAEFEITPDSDTPWHVTNIVLRKLKSTKQFALLDPEIAECRDAGVDYKWKNVGWQNRGKREPLSKVLFYSGYKKHPDDYPLIKGENIDRYHVQHADNYVIHDFLKYKTVENTILVYLDLALVPIKILTRQTSARIQAAVDINQYVTAKSVHTTIIKDTSYSVYFVQSVMNSSLMNYVYSMRTGEVGRTFAQIKLYDLRDLPIRRISFHTPQEQKTAVLATAKTHYQQAVQDY